MWDLFGQNEITFCMNDFEMMHTYKQDATRNIPFKLPIYKCTILKSVHQFYVCMYKIHWVRVLSAYETTITFFFFQKFFPHLKVIFFIVRETQNQNAVIVLCKCSLWIGTNDNSYKLFLKTATKTRGVTLT